MKVRQSQVNSIHRSSSYNQTETPSYRSLWERWMRAARWLRTRHRCEISRNGPTILFARFYYKLFSAPTLSRNIVASGVLVCMNAHPEVLRRLRVSTQVADF